jgi:hypothetical protein
MSDKKIVTDDRIQALPLLIRNWLKRANVVGNEFTYTVHLHQTGEMRTSPHGRWMPFKAEQYNKVEEPAFIWLARVKAAPLITLTGRDNYQNGKGEMQIKLLNLISVVHATGPEIDQGALIRYMAESVWFPSSALANYFAWEQISNSQVKCTMNHRGVSSSGIFTFDSKGDVQSFEAMRFFQQKQTATLEKWHVDLEPSGLKDFEGIRIPAKATVTWKLKEGDFTWLKLEITQLEFNKVI